MPEIQKRGSFTAIADRTTEPAVVGDGTLVSTLPGYTYGLPKRWAVRITATATGAFQFNLAMRTFNASAWGPIGLGAGDLYGGELFTGTDSGQWEVEGEALGDAEALCAVASNTSGTALAIVVSVAPMVEF